MRERILTNAIIVIGLAALLTVASGDQLRAFLGQAAGMSLVWVLVLAPMAAIESGVRAMMVAAPQPVYRSRDFRWFLES
ncbi:MAG: hypothetical protein AB7S38_20550 [Vulcanimicrobiota bacterium]